MSSSELIDEGGSIEESPEVLYPTNTRVNDMFFSDPEILPRVGDEYQAEIPTLMSVPDYIRLTESINNRKNTRFSFDLLNQIRLMDSGKVERTGESFGCKGDHDMITNEGESERPGVKLESLDTVIDDKTSLGKLWSDTEETIFLLSLYIFRKNFDQVKRFIECMKMEDVLSHYYGTFYGSVKYHKWKKKCIRRIYGMKIFSGLRQKELLSRLLPHCSEDCRQTIIEVSKTFGEGSISLEEYVFTVKSMVGMKNLIEAVGLGKNKHDLTRVTRESLRSSQGLPVRAEIPTGKECATLTAEDIVKFLTGDFRLSKAKSSDLFWEAVWPRLLARGWTSLQPKDRNSLVFLMPGVKKFSRQKLTKGDQYFDSVADVLSKVGSEPDLLELESEADNKVIKLTDDEKMDGSDLFDHHQQQHCQQYLQPKIARKRSDQDLAQITVIDTSNSSDEAIEESDHASRNQDFLMNGSHSTVAPGKIHRDHNIKKCNDTRARKSKKCPSNQSLAPVFQRRRRLSACSRSERKHEPNGFLTSARLKHQDSQNSSNIPESNESITTQVTEKQVDERNTVHISTEQHPNTNLRRQGTRVRPPTTKALEAFAHGYLTVNERKRRGDKSGTRPYRKRVRAKTDDKSKQENEVCASSSNPK